MTKSERLQASGIDRFSGKTFAEQMAGKPVNMTNMHPDIVRYIPPMDYWRWNDGSHSNVRIIEGGRQWELWQPKAQRTTSSVRDWQRENLDKGDR